MLKLEIPKSELFNERLNEFISVPKCTISLEHSLVSISKWEAIYNKPFLKGDEKTYDELLTYIKCMTITPNVDENCYHGLTASHFTKIKDYIKAPMTATTFRDDNRPPSRQIITAELIYYKMIEHGIPFECQKWHLNRLLTLIRVCDIRNAPQKKMSKADIFAQNRALNASRRAAMNSRG